MIYNQNKTVAAMVIADRNSLGHRAFWVEIHRKSFG
ncbi:MAG: hypothetical protein ACJAXT_002204, partial [Paracoccaceae bacterium]